jgi:hypothetical protein
VWIASIALGLLAAGVSFFTRDEPAATTPPLRPAASTP